ncbi:hypothetical protein Baya_8346 [Bagarius yarrelli]|uniref:Uncharacterized protein n=1 Tax=Bagarius yarrelli TaxID=175774 RepID=A0A556U4R0_BAGYA|nr:hypothetical protein Baya_8346 [Bagarius yarrelli]
MQSHSLAVRAQRFDLSIVPLRAPRAMSAPRRTHALQTLKAKIYCPSNYLKHTNAQIRTCTIHGREAFSLPFPALHNPLAPFEMKRKGRLLLPQLHKGSVIPGWLHSLSPQSSLQEF